MNQKIIESLESHLAEIRGRKEKSGHDNNLCGSLENAITLAKEGDTLRPVPVAAAAPKK